MGVGVESNPYGNRGASEIKQGKLKGGESFVATIEPLVQAIHPQAFRGGMQRFESDRVALEMVAVGFPVDKVRCVLAADKLGESWDGVALPQGRLP